MPIYDFICLTHGKFEAIRGSNVTSASCPKCGKRAPKKEFSTPAPAQFVGSGFHCNSYPNAKTK